MAIHANSTTAPARPLLPRRDARGRFVKLAAEFALSKSGELSVLPIPPLLPADTPRAVASDVPHGAAPKVCATAAQITFAPMEGNGADLGRAIHLRRQLEAAAEHGADLLAALGLPRLVGPEHIIFDPVAAGDALTAAIAALDALDGDTDREPYLAGYYNPLADPTGEGEPSEDDEDDGTGEATLGAPERHPDAVSMGLSYYKPANGLRPRRIHPDAGQTTWAQGSRQDGEGEPEAGYDLPCDPEEDDDGNHRGELDESEKDQNLGAPAGDGDQRRWAQGDSREYEDMAEGDGQAPAEWYKRSVGPVRFQGVCHDYGPELRAARRQAEAVRRRVKGPAALRDPDLLIMYGPGRMIWRGPYVTRDGVHVIGVATA